MCGICGILNFSNFQDEIISVKRMTDQMYNRGPNDEGIVAFGHNYILNEIFGGQDTPHNVWQSKLDFSPKREFSNINASLALGQRRLSIIDLSETGHQPLSYSNNNFWIVFNGEIYNFNELKSDLKGRGYKFVGNSDTEVIVAGYQEWGSDIVNYLDGMFSFAIFDTIKKELFVSRDRLGIKPFYYFLDSNKFLFASDLKTILASGVINREINYDGLYDCFSFGVTPRPNTIFVDIKGLEPAHWMKITVDGKITKERYWTIPIGNKYSNISEKDALENLDDLLHKAVKKRLIADVPVSSFMSGGVDSTVITAIASKYHEGINAFTIGFENQLEGNEIEEAKAVAKNYQINHVIDYVDIEHVDEILRDVVCCYEEPKGFIDPQYLLSQAVLKHDIKVALNGLGADELFGGYNYHIWLKKWKAIRMLSPGLKLLKNRNIFFSKLYESSKLDSATDFTSLNWAYFSEDLKQKIFKSLIFNKNNTIKHVRELYKQNYDFADDLDEIEYADLCNYLPNHFLYRSDQFMMRFSLEGRYPYLDNDLVDFSFRLPSDLKVKGRIGKYLLKRKAEDYIPWKNIYMKKKGFRLPLDNILKNSLQDLIKTSIVKLTDRDIFNKQVILQIVDKIDSGKERSSAILQLLMTEIWFEEFIDG
jgi:asparagine synthase (glutamine-hydrolysing)